MDCSTPGFPVYHQLSELAQTHIQSNQWYHPTISSSVIPVSSCLQSFPVLGSFPVSQFFTLAGQSFSFSISPSDEYSGLISFRIDCFVPQGTLKSLLQHQSFELSILQLSAFFVVQLSNLYMITRKTIDGQNLKVIFFEEIHLYLVFMHLFEKYTLPLRLPHIAAFQPDFLWSCGHSPVMPRWVESRGCESVWGGSECM